MMIGTAENSRTRCVTVKPSRRGIMMSSSDEIRSVGLDLFERRLPVAHRDHFVAIQFQVASDQSQDLMDHHRRPGSSFSSLGIARLQIDSKLRRRATREDLNSAGGK